MQYKLNELVNVIIDNRGKNPPYYTKTGIPIIDNYLIKNNYYPNVENVNRYIDKNLLKNFIRCKTKKDDVLVTLVGNGLGNCCLCPNNAVIIQNTIGLRFKNHLCLQKFAYYKLTTITKQIKQLNRGASQPSVKISDFLNIKIFVPVLDIQQHIVNTIGTIDDLIENYCHQEIKICELLDKSLKEYNEFISFEYYNPVIIKSGIKKFSNSKEYLDTSSIEGINNIVGSQYVVYNKRPSRANMQPIENSVWFSKMKESTKILIVTDKDQDISGNNILSTGFMGIKSSKQLPLSLLSAIVTSQNFIIQRDLNSVGTTMAGINNNTFYKILVPKLNEEQTNSFNNKYCNYVYLLSQLRRKIKELRKIKILMLSKYF